MIKLPDNLAEFNGLDASVEGHPDILYRSIDRMREIAESRSWEEYVLYHWHINNEFVRTGLCRTYLFESFVQYKEYQVQALIWLQRVEQFITLWDMGNSVVSFWEFESFIQPCSWYGWGNS